MNVYEHCPEVSNEKFLLRLIAKEDCADLLKVYGDPQAAALFNSDNCHGDTFYYQTLERMAQAIDFWIFSYNKRYFVRWSIIDREKGEVIGTIELFRREALGEKAAATGLLRLDLRSDYETAESIESILLLVMKHAYEWFECTSLTTKAVPQASVRRSVFAKLGFAESSDKLKGNDGTLYGDYFVCTDMHKCMQNA